MGTLNWKIGSSKPLASNMLTKGFTAFQRGNIFFIDKGTLKLWAAKDGALKKICHFGQSLGGQSSLSGQIDLASTLGTYNFAALWATEVYSQRWWQVWNCGWAHIKPLLKKW